MTTNRSTVPAHLKPNGFTLLELMVTVAVAAVLATLAAPSFKEFIASQRMKSASFDLLTALTLARSEAITRGADVKLAKPAAGWSGGWTVEIATSGNVLLTQDALKGLAMAVSPNTDNITYTKDGRSSTGAGTTFTITPSTSISGITKCRAITVGLSGAPRSKEVTCPT